MMLQHGLSEDSSYTVNQSLRFRASASAYLSRTPGVTGNRTTWTFSEYVKLGAIGVNRFLLCAYQDANNFDYFYLTAANTLVYWQRYAGSDYQVQTTPVFRDPSAHYHVNLAINQGAAAADRVIISVNGVRQPVTGTGSGILTHINVASQQHMISRSNSGEYLDGYLSEINFIDGQALDPSYFGQTDPATGIWVPKKYTGTYGANGFYLPFNDATSLTTLGYDRSGNGNNWTCNGISITAGATYDVMKDSPTNGPNEVGNYATLNPLDNRFMVGILSNANLQVSFNAPPNLAAATSTIPILSGDKVYFECVSSTATYPVSCGIRKVGSVPSSTEYLGYIAGEFAYRTISGNKVNNNVKSAYGATATSGDVIGCAVDLVDGKVWWSKNGVWQASGDPYAGTNPAYSGLSGDYYPAFGTEAGAHVCTCSVNFGQRPFAYTPPTGFKPLHTGNLTQPTIKKPQQHFDVKLDTGANIKTTCEGLYTYFLEWIKDRGNSNNHQLIDTVRGTSAVLQSNTTAAETAYVAPSGSSVGWVWNTGSAAVSNTAGSITSQVSANTIAGFSVVTYTGTGANATVGHGLGVAPKMVIVKKRAGTVGAGFSDWLVWHTGIANTEVVYLNATVAKATLSNAWNSTSPTSSTFSVGINTFVNENISAYVAYCFAEIPGYSKFGSYVGNGSADGPFVFTGFRPRWVLTKCSTGVSQWVVHDTARNAYNVADLALYPNLASYEDSGVSGRPIDMTSNGFKIRTTDADINSNTNTYIFAAFAESPFALNNRAR